MIKRLLIAVGLPVVVTVGLSWSVGSILTEPTNHPVPLPAGFHAQAVSIPAVGHSVAAWWIDAGSATPVVLLVHGINADRTSMVDRAQLLEQHGFSVLLIDLQAHGETPGAEITLGLKESGDVSAARDWVRGTLPGRKLGVVGTSLGGASVLLEPQPSGFDAVVLEAAFPRIGRAIENRMRMRFGSLAPVVTPLLLWQIGPRLHATEADLEPIRSIGRLGAPVLVVAGSADQHTTLEESKELYEAAAEPKSFWVVEGATHQDFLRFDPMGYETRVIGFLEKTLCRLR
jgi:fermentation-respiration switch protein FrsA (DUF1100 family)